jgi:hypothetical protein
MFKVCKSKKYQNSQNNAGNQLDEIREKNYI